MHIIENEFLKVSVNEEGAELYSIYDKEMEKETLWYGDEKFWARRSPILFPNVGRNFENYCIYNGERFDTELHGFARSSLFQCIDKKEDCISFQLSDTEATRAYFPFAFQLKISYLLEGRNLKVLWEVTNQDDKTMYFTIGGHPGFNVPILENTKQTDYKLIFKQPELEYILVHEGGSGTADPTKPYQLSLEPVGEYYGCPVTEHMFDNDALIFDNSQVQWVGIAYPDGTPYITMDCSGFTNFGIWSLPGAPYICLEPWMGRCDNYGFHDEISEKPDIVSLEAKNTFKTSYTIGVHKK